MFQVAAPPAPDRSSRIKPCKQQALQPELLCGPPPRMAPRARTSLQSTNRGSPDDAIKTGLCAALAQATRQRDHGASAAVPLAVSPVDESELFFSLGSKPPALALAPSPTRPAGLDANFRERHRPRHQKHFSASASLPSAPVDKDEGLLRPPPRSLRLPTRASSTETSAAAGPAATMAYPAAVQVMPAVQYEPYRPPNDYYSAAGHYARPSERPVDQSTEDFIMRTERSTARARTMKQQYLEQQREYVPNEEPQQRDQDRPQHRQQYHHHHREQQEPMQRRYQQSDYQREEVQAEEGFAPQGYSRPEYSQPEQPQWNYQHEYQPDHVRHEPRQRENQGRQQGPPHQEQYQQHRGPSQHGYQQRMHLYQEQNQRAPQDFDDEQPYSVQQQPVQSHQYQHGPQPTTSRQEQSGRHQGHHQSQRQFQQPRHQPQRQPQHHQEQYHQQQQRQEWQYQEDQRRQEEQQWLQEQAQKRQQEEEEQRQQREEQKRQQEEEQKRRQQEQERQQRQQDEEQKRLQQLQLQRQQKQKRQQEEEQKRHQQKQQLEQSQKRSSPPKPALQTAASNARVIPERLPEGAPRPFVYNTPRRISNASNSSSSTGTTALSRESLESRIRSPSWSSQTSLESFYSSHSAGQSPTFGWQRPAPLKQRRKARPGELFSALPGEVLELILDEVKKLHLAPGSISCATCWMRDACNVALSARKWLKYARTALYEDIQLVGSDSLIHKKKYRGITGTRLVLLRRSLRANPILAAAVRSLKVPATPSSVSADEYQNLVATVVMACPNLEKVVGFYPAYDHSYGRFFQAVSSRQRLKEMNWVVQPSPFQRQQRMLRAADDQGTLAHQRNLITPGDLQPQQAINWVNWHTNWRHLASLTVHCNPGATLTPDTLLVDTLAHLPALQTLNVSHLPHNAFNDSSLLTLPPLKKLSMFHLSGITSAGLSAFATRRASRSLETLTLVHVDIDSLPALARALSNLTSLESLSLVQAVAPVLPADEFIWLFPYLASSSLKRLHWDMTSAAHNASATDSILAKSIVANGFPSLRRLRAPADPEGVFQSVCKPLEKIDLPSDRYRHQKSSHSRAESTASSQPSSDSSSRGAGHATTPHSSGASGEGGISKGGPRLASDLHQARLAAQTRLEAARLRPRFVVNVTDEDGTLVDKFGLGSFIGDTASKVHYHLLPDAGALDEKGGLVDVTDLLGDGGEDLTASVGGPTSAAEGKETPVALGKKEKEKKSKAGEEVKTREGCQGRWNTFSGPVVDKKDKERWFHTERGRWRGVSLS